MSVAIHVHTTASSPRPHVLYKIDASLNGSLTKVTRRYSEFVALHNALHDPYPLPPKRILVTSFIPSAWADDELIAERKFGLERYLNLLLKSPDYSQAPALLAFLSYSPPSPLRTFNLEDALPSTLPRKTALEIKAELLKNRRVNAASSSTPIYASYYPDWASGSNPPSSLDFTQFDIIFFAFATISSSYGLSWDSGSQTTLQELVTARNNSGQPTKISLSVGGWGGCEYYSAAVSSSANRTTLVNALVSAVDTYSLSGIDLDWEYPNSSGAGQPYSSSDSANFLKFLTQLRSALGSSALITATAPDTVWLGSNGSPMTSGLAAYAAQLSYVNIMNYDVNGSSSTPGANAPLGNLCGTSWQPAYSAEAAFSQWTGAGFPANQLLLGLPLYGYCSQSSMTTLTGSFKTPDEADANPRPAPQNGCSMHKPAAKPVVNKGDEAVVNLSSWWGQQIPFNELVSSGVLARNSNNTFSESGGYTEGWDNCSDTPFLFNTSADTVITYDDTYSLGDKASYAVSSGMAGCFTWSLDQDDGYDLTIAIRQALGKSS